MASPPIARKISECFIKPKHNPNQAQEVVHLTPWDIFVLSHPYIQKGFLFNSDPNPIDPFLRKLKNSLSIALSHFYSLAGQLETKANRDDDTYSIFIDCNKGPGARFIHATLDMKASEIMSRTDQHEVIDLLFDRNGVVNHDGHARPLITVQVTKLIDGVFVACCMNHVCADGESYWHFLKSWSEIFMANGDENTPISRSPVYERWFIDGSGPIRLSHDKLPKRILQQSEFKERVFHFSAESISKLKSKANSECAVTDKISSFQALGGHVWRCITRARSMANEEYTDCALTFNNRKHLNPHLPQNYFGNCVQISLARAKVGELLQHSLGWAAMKLNEVIVSHDDEKVRDRIRRWMKNPSGGVFRVGGCSVLFGGSTRLDSYGVEFGMGKAMAVVSGSGSKRDGKVVCGEGRDEKGSVDLEVYVNEVSMNALLLDAEFLEFVSL